MNVPADILGKVKVIITIASVFFYEAGVSNHTLSYLIKGLDFLFSCDKLTYIMYLIEMGKIP